jgi:hypothetical protein
MRRNKFNAKRTIVDGLTVHSKGEAARWQELKLLERAGEITELDRQVPYDLTVKGEVIGSYVADFTYFERDKTMPNLRHVVEDFKGFRTAEYRLKAKLMKAIYGIEIRETGKGTWHPRKKAA